MAADLLNLALQEFPDDYLATYEQRLRGYGRAAIEAEMRTQFPKPPLTMVVIAPSAEGLVRRLRDQIARGPRTLRLTGLRRA